MTDTLPTTGSGKPRPMLGGGWIDGPCNPAPIMTGYNPAALVHDVAAILAAAGVEGVYVDQPTAVIAAADLLNAMGVTPASAPLQQPAGSVIPARDRGDDA